MNNEERIKNLEEKIISLEEKIYRLMDLHPYGMSNHNETCRITSPNMRKKYATD